jgi:hypothetical protein
MMRNAIEACERVALAGVEARAMASGEGDGPASFLSFEEAGLVRI